MLGDVSSDAWASDEWKWDVVFHCAAKPRIQPSFVSPSATIESNVKSTVNALEIARHYGSKFIYAGSSTCDGDFFANPYALSKHLGEDICRLYAQVYGVPCAVARFYNVYGPRQIESGPYATAMGVWEKAYREGNPLPVCGDGSKRRDWTHVLDIVSGLVAIGEWMQGDHGDDVPVFYLGRGESLSVSEVVAMFGGDVAPQCDRPGESQATLANDAFTRDAIGWNPQRSISEYIHSVRERACLQRI
jgi:UDP-glucose 4-epimerase